MIHWILIHLFVCFLGCSTPVSTPVKEPGEIRPDVVTEKVSNDSDDPAVWYNKADPSQSIIFGTDKHSDGAIYAFDLQGKILAEKTIQGLERPNNVDIGYNLRLNENKVVDVLAFTEREREQVRLFSIPDMKALDKGGFPVFEDETDADLRQPMGISFYTSPVDGSFYLIVGRKEGPREAYLYQYKLKVKNSEVLLELVRKFGKYSGEKEIEAIAVDDELGFVYYADEAFGIRKYFAEPSMGDEEVANFGGEYFEGDIEGIAIAKGGDDNGVIIVSNQQEDTFNVFSRRDNSFIQEIDLGTEETDGCEVINLPLNETFSSGLFVAMNNEQNFFLYNLEKLQLPLE